MPATAAQIRANKANSARSTGPRTDEGKERSRANAYKHGLTATVVIPEREAIEVQRRFEAFANELAPATETGLSLIRIAATMSVRMERCVEYENAILTERVRQAEASFVPPAGVDAAEAAKLRVEAGKRALFDTSKEATLARRYEVAAHRTFFRALKELRIVETQAKVTQETKVEAELASIMPPDLSSLRDEEVEKLFAETMARFEQYPYDRIDPNVMEVIRDRIDVPFAIGKRP